jgi:hypothetical protein
MLIQVVMVALVEAAAYSARKVACRDQVTPHQHPHLKVMMVVLGYFLLRILAPAVAVQVRLDQMGVVIMLVLVEQGVQMTIKPTVVRLMPVVVVVVLMLASSTVRVAQAVLVVPVAVVLVERGRMELRELTVLVEAVEVVVGMRLMGKAVEEMAVLVLLLYGTWQVLHRQQVEPLQPMVLVLVNIMYILLLILLTP